MKNTLKEALFATLSLLCLYSTATSATECSAGQSENYAVIPHFYAASNNDAAFYVTNHSSKNIEVKVELYTHTGSEYSGSLATYYMFSSSNNPFQSWASLSSKEQGMLYIPFGVAATSGHARVSWKSEECLATPVTVSLQRQATSYGGGMSNETFGPF